MMTNKGLIRTILLLILTVSVTPLTAMTDNKLCDNEPQDTVITTKRHPGKWTTSTTPALKIDNHYYDNWTATGISQLVFLNTFNGTYKYTTDNYTWDNIINLALGLYWQDLDGDTTQHGFAILESRRKNDDKIDLTTTFSMKLKNSWNINASANFKSQFLEGYTYTATDTTLISNFMAPAYLTTALGFECKKEDWNVSLSFLTGKTTFLLDEDVIRAGQLYGVDTTGGKRVYAGLGSYVKLYYKKDIAKNLNFYTRLELFYDYRKPTYRTNNTNALLAELDDISQYEATDNSWPTYMVRNGDWENAGKRDLYTLLHDTDVDFEFKLEYRFSKFFSAYLMSRLKYDSDFTGRSRIFGSNDCRWQVYQSAGVQLYFNWKTPNDKPRRAHRDRCR